MPNVSLRILVVEDDENMSLVIQRRVSLLKSAFPSAMILPAMSLREAEEFIDSDPPFDVVLLDLSFPDSSWKETLARLPKFEKRAAVVVVTGRKRWEIEDLLARHDIEIIEKGSELLEQDTLFQAIAKAFSRRRDKQMGAELLRIDNILARFNSLPHADTGSPATQ